MRDFFHVYYGSVEALLPNAIFAIMIIYNLTIYNLRFIFDCNDAIKREQNEACFSYAEREHHRSVISESRRKGTA